MDRLQTLRVVVAVVEAGGFTAAGRRLGLTTARVSRIIAEAEASLGVQLFQRTTRQVIPTDAALGFAGRVGPILPLLDAAVAEARDAQPALMGRVRISAPASFGAAYLTPVLARFALEHPGLEIEVGFTDRRVDLIAEGVDLAIRGGVLPDSALVARRLAPLAVVVCAHPDLVRQFGMPDLPEALVDWPTILDTNRRDPQLWPFQRADGSALTVAVTGRLRFANADACLAAALTGAGATYVPTFAAGPLLQAGTLVPLLTGWRPPPSALYAVYPSTRYLTAAVRATIDCLVAAFSGVPSWDRGWG